MTPCAYRVLLRTGERRWSVQWRAVDLAEALEVRASLLADLPGAVVVVQGYAPWRWCRVVGEA